MIRGYSYSKSMVIVGVVAVVAAAGSWGWMLIQKDKAQKAAATNASVINSLQSQIASLTPYTTLKVEAERKRAEEFKSRLIGESAWENFANEALGMKGEWVATFTDIVGQDGAPATADYVKRKATLQLIASGVAEWAKIVKAVEAVESQGDLFGVSAIEIHSIDDAGRRAFDTVRLEVVFYAPKK